MWLPAAIASLKSSSAPGSSCSLRRISASRAVAVRCSVGLASQQRARPLERGARLLVGVDVRRHLADRQRGGPVRPRDRRCQTSSGTGGVDSPRVTYSTTWSGVRYRRSPSTSSSTLSSWCPDCSGVVAHVERGADRAARIGAAQVMPGQVVDGRRARPTGGSGPLPVDDGVHHCLVPVAGRRVEAVLEQLGAHEVLADPQLELSPGYVSPARANSSGDGSGSLTTRA